MISNDNNGDELQNSILYDLLAAYKHDNSWIEKTWRLQFIMIGLSLEYRINDGLRKCGNFVSLIISKQRKNFTQSKFGTYGNAKFQVGQVEILRMDNLTDTIENSAEYLYLSV